VNFIALGLGVMSTCTGIGGEATQGAGDR
jgi:hypothetical protein